MTPPAPPSPSRDCVKGIITEASSFPGDLVDRAVASGDEHTIKDTEACLREHALAPDPGYLAAARVRVERTAPR